MDIYENIIQQKKFRNEMKGREDKLYTQYLGVTLTNMLKPNKQCPKRVFRVYQKMRVSKTKLIKELKELVYKLEKEQNQIKTKQKF